ncbi:hypothetical protein K440DRAFT_628033 [Wilcoxina mikolae CBS 423.85]|nr:hypothetical protein K440DRAFT_628033 [Wilcoxina mikolae CBS 423.85]
MLPVTPLAPPKTQQPFHEGLQDMVSHPFSHRQTFVPVSESKEFTRVDAGKEFGLPPTEEAVPHPDLIKIAKERDMGLELDERVDLQKERERVQQEQSDKEKMRKAAREKPSKVIEHGRFAWRLKDATTGKVGFRYGVPHQDRKKGQVKIPTHVG